MTMLLSVFITVLFALSNILAENTTEYIVEPVKLSEAPYAEWAHYHWVWIGNSETHETQANLLQLVTDYLSRSIPVGAINVDSAWPQKYQNFKWDSSRFPDPAQMVNHLHSLDIKVICWITSTINNDSSNFIEAKQNGYMLNDGKLIHWWRGHGGLLDYSNPKAVDWWHKQMDELLNIGIDGWKCDGTDPYVWELIDARGYKGHITEREYADAYYRDFLYYTRQKRGDEALIMARPVDNWDELLFVNYAPNDVMFSGWVGDQHGDWNGIQVALDNIIHSAWRGYLNFGCDIAGYVTDGKSELGREKSVFIRWFQLGAFLPLMENGGQGEHRPWIFGDDVTPIYRLFASIHTELSVYLLNAGTECFAKNISVIKPIARKIPFGRPSVFDYLLHNDLFVSPFVDNTTQKRIKFPGNAGDKWLYWFNTSVQFRGGDETTNFACPFSEFPVFIRGGSILPLKVESPYSKMGNFQSKGFITVLITKPTNGTHIKDVHEFKSDGFRITYVFNRSQKTMEILISGHPKHRFIILLDSINASPIVVQMKKSSDSLQMVAEEQDENQFWQSNLSSVFKPTLRKAFIKITEKAHMGLHIKINNIN